jgi:2',3'-cyclic-nucleotide 2'-phosphodiesterase (5'-nucleotidase family)
MIAFVSLALILCACSREESDDSRTIKPAHVTILYSGDLLGNILTCGCTAEDSGGLGRRATYTVETKGREENVLVLDVGDLFSSEISFSKKEAELTMDALDLMGVDVLTPGEKEFIFGLPFLQAADENFSFDLVAANIVDPYSGDPVFGSGYVVKELAGGLRIAITGVLDESIRFPGYIDDSGFRIEPAEEALRRVLPAMKEEADFLILLSHMGMEHSKLLLTDIVDFDLAIIGHGKPIVKRLEKFGKTVILAAGGIGQYLGRADITISSSGEMVTGNMKLVMLPNEMAVHQGVADLFSDYGLPMTEKEAKRR